MSRRLATPATAPPFTLDALRSEIDVLDDSILQLIERRQALAQRVGGFKVAADDLRLPLKPDREFAVLSRLLERAAPETRKLVLAVWRELIAAGLAQQQEIAVVVWSDGRPDVAEQARRRFGAAAVHRAAASPEEALQAAAEGPAVAVLALSRASAWWAELLTARHDLWVFDAVYGARGPTDPSALAVGRIDPVSLTGGVTYRVSTGGDAGGGGGRSVLLGMADGLRLYAEPGRAVTAQDRARGYVGAAPVLGVRP